MVGCVVDSAKNVVNLGEDQYRSFVKERFVERSKAVNEPLKRNNLATFKTGKKRIASRDKAKVQVLKEDCALFSRLYKQVRIEMGILMTSSNTRISLGHHHLRKLETCVLGRRQI